MDPAAADTGEVPPRADCRRCGRPVRGQPADAAGWCGECRAALIRDATRLALIPAAVVGLLYLWLLLWSGLLESPLMVLWLALGAVLAFVAYKIARRVFFDVLRGRATGDGDG